MQLMKYQEIIAMTKELKDKALAPMRAKQARVAFDAAIAKMEEKIYTAQAKVQDICSDTNLSVDKLMDHLDEIALMERRLKKLEEVKIQLFGE